MASPGIERYHVEFDVDIQFAKDLTPKKVSYHVRNRLNMDNFSATGRTKIRNVSWEKLK